MSEDVATVAWLALGCNLGHRGQALQTLREQLLSAPGVLVLTASRQLMTRPVGITRQPDFLNQVIRVQAAEPGWSPHDWLGLCKRAETAAGRRFTYRWGPRRADADLLLLGGRGTLRVHLPDLSVPHPELDTRTFLCALLADLDPTLTHPDGWRFLDRAGHLIG